MQLWSPTTIRSWPSLTPLAAEPGTSWPALETARPDPRLQSRSPTPASPPSRSEGLSAIRVAKIFRIAGQNAPNELPTAILCQQYCRTACQGTVSLTSEHGSQADRHRTKNVGRGKTVPYLRVQKTRYVYVPYPSSAKQTGHIRVTRASQGTLLASDASANSTARRTAVSRWNRIACRKSSSVLAMRSQSGAICSNSRVNVSQIDICGVR